MHIVMFNEIDDAGEALKAINLNHNRKVIQCFMFISGGQINGGV